MAKKSITDYFFAIGTDRMTEQHEETEEPCEFKFCVMITLCHVFLVIRISRLLLNHLKDTELKQDNIPF